MKEKVRTTLAVLKEIRPIEQIENLEVELEYNRRLSRR